MLGLEPLREKNPGNRYLRVKKPLTLRSVVNEVFYILFFSWEILLRFVRMQELFLILDSLLPEFCTRRFLINFFARFWY